MILSEMEKGLSEKAAAEQLSIKVRFDPESHKNATHKKETY